MNKSQLAEAIAETAGITKAQAKRAIEAFISTTAEAMKAGEKIILIGFGTFEAVNKPARKGRDPRTGATIQIAAKKVVKFKPGAQLCDTVR